MFFVEGSRAGAKFFQEFKEWSEANEKAKWLAQNGFEVWIIPHAHALS